MDKQIKKIKRSEMKAEKALEKGVGETNRLLKMDKKNDKLIEKAKKMKKR